MAVASAVALLAMVVLGADGVWTFADYVLGVLVGGLAYIVAGVVLWLLYVRGGGR